MSLNIRGNSRNTGRDNNRQHGDSQGHRGPDLRSLVSKLGRRGSSNKEGNNNNTINTASPSASWWAATASGSPNSKPCNTSTPPTITRGRPISYSSDNNSYYYPHPPPPPAQQPAITSAPRPSAPIAHRPGSWEFPPSPASSSLLLWGGGGSSSQSGQGGRVISDAGSRSSYYSNSGGSSNVDNTSLAVDPSTSLIPAMSTFGIQAGLQPPAHILDPGAHPTLAAVEACMTWHELTLVNLAAERRRCGRRAFYANPRVAEVEAWNMKRLALWTDKRLEMVLEKVVDGI